MILHNVERREWMGYFKTVRLRIRTSQVPLVARLEVVENYKPLTTEGDYELLKDLTYDPELNCVTVKFRGRSVVVENLSEVWVNEDETGLPMWIAFLTLDGKKWFTSIQSYDSPLPDENNPIGGK